MAQETRYTIASGVGTRTAASRIESYFKDIQKATSLKELVDLRNKMGEQGYIVQTFQHSGSVEEGRLVFRDGERSFVLEKEKAPIPKNTPEEQAQFIDFLWEEQATSRLESRAFDMLKSSMLEGLNSATKSNYEKYNQASHKSATSKVFSHFFGLGKGQLSQNWLIGLILLPVLLQVVLPITAVIDIPNSISRIISNSRMKSLVANVEKTTVEQAEMVHQKELDRKAELEQFMEEAQNKAEEMERQEQESQQEEAARQEDEEQQEEQEQEEEEGLDVEEETPLNEEGGLSSDDLSEMREELQRVREERQEEQRREQQKRENIVLDKERPQDLRGMPEREAKREEEIKTENNKTQSVNQIRTEEEGVLVTRELMVDASQTSANQLGAEARQEMGRIEALQKELGLRDTFGLGLYDSSVKACEAEASKGDANKSALASKNLQGMVDDLRSERLSLELQSRVKDADIRKMRQDQTKNTIQRMGRDLSSMSERKIGPSPAQDVRGNLYTGANQFILQKSMKDNRFSTPVFLSPSQMKEFGLEKTPGAKGVQLFYQKNNLLRSKRVFNVEELQIDGTKFKDTKEFQMLIRALKGKEAGIDRILAEKNYKETMLAVGNKDNIAVVDAMARIMSGLGSSELSPETQAELKDAFGFDGKLDGTYQNLVNGTGENGEFTEKDFADIFSAADKAMIASVVRGKCEDHGFNVSDVIDEEFEKEEKEERGLGPGEEKDNDRDNEPGEEEDNDNSMDM